MKMKTRQTATDAGARRITKNELESLNTALLVGHTVSITQTLPNLITGNKPAVTLVVLWSFTATIPQPKFREAYLQRYRSLVYPLSKRLRQEWIRTAESVKPADLQAHHLSFYFFGWRVCLVKLVIMAPQDTAETPFWSVGPCGAQRRTPRPLSGCLRRGLGNSARRL